MQVCKYGSYARMYHNYSDINFIYLGIRASVEEYTLSRAKLTLVCVAAQLHLIKIRRDWCLVFVKSARQVPLLSDCWPTRECGSDPVTHSDKLGRAADECGSRSLIVDVYRHMYPLLVLLPSVNDDHMALGQKTVLSIPKERSHLKQACRVNGILALYGEFESVRQTRIEENCPLFTRLPPYPGSQPVSVCCVKSVPFSPRGRSDTTTLMEPSENERWFERRCYSNCQPLAIVAIPSIVHLIRLGTVVLGWRNPRHLPECHPPVWSVFHARRVEWLPLRLVANFSSVSSVNSS
ncbi:hypothetical protein BaRGS_00019401 [Batillaria attramentaria]|uniref:Uncharacterized protein n=1 Tax=Batillaria attramentaria TaxID=370345 RepID=A0ABD0KPV4_9CAEN